MDKGYKQHRLYTCVVNGNDMLLEGAIRCCYRTGDIQWIYNRANIRMAATRFQSQPMHGGRRGFAYIVAGHFGSSPIHLASPGGNAENKARAGALANMME